LFQKETLIKHYTFLLIDVVSVSLALLLANVLRFNHSSLHDFDDLYVEVLFVSLAACVFGNVAFQLDKHIFDRGYYQEFIAVIKSCLCIGVAVLTYLFLTHKAAYYSRLQMIYFFLFYFILAYFGHLMMKPLIVKYYHGSKSCKQIMLITSTDKLDSILEKFEKTNNWYFQLSYIVLVDQKCQGQIIKGIPVIANLENMLEASREIALDGVFINVSYQSYANFDARRVLHDFQEMGVVVHVNIDALELDVTDKVIENLGFFKVVSYASRLYEPGQMILKRLMDIIGSLIGLVITFIFAVFVIPAICVESKGSPLYTQIRVGKNGRHFKMYKFRSMYLDADIRKRELMEQNEMQGAMFKIQNDPRITKVGKFIRKFSIDELPQFINVLKGDMSLVGTRPPTVEEVEQYRTEQKRRLSVTPGMTGLWQTSGRNNIYNFDEIVKLDLEYIDQWSLGLDIRLLIKTVIVCFRGNGAE